MEAPTWKYDVALSYAGEDREPVRELARQVQTAGYSIFFDEFEELWGEDLSVKLHEIYETQSRFCVVFVSKHYLNKPWTNQERKAIFGRTLRQKTPYLLPVRLDDSELPGLAVTAYKDLRQCSIREIFDSLKKMLGPPAVRPTQYGRKSDLDMKVSMFPRNFLGIVVHKDDKDIPRFNLDCHLINEREGPTPIRRLEAIVTPSGKRGMQFVWNVFYEFQADGLVMNKTGDAKSLNLDRQESRFLGVQFVGPRLEWQYQWLPGQYEFDVMGWGSRGPREVEADLRTRFLIEISPDEWYALNYWFCAPASEWKIVGDRDRDSAIAVPVTIIHDTLRVG